MAFYTAIVAEKTGLLLPLRYSMSPYLELPANRSLKGRFCHQKVKSLQSTQSTF
jgi:hypothetical protein